MGPVGEISWNIVRAGEAHRMISANSEQKR